jgi:AraC family transcriptional regulator
VTISESQFGRTIRAVRIASGEVTEIVTRAGIRAPEHAHDAGEITFVLDGAYSNTEHGITTHVGPGSVHIHEPRSPHATEVDPDAEVTALRVSVDRDRWPAPLASGILSPAASLFEVLAAEIRLELAQADDLAAPCLEALLTLVALKLRRTTPNRVEEPVWLRAAVAAIEQNYALPLSLQIVADSVGVNRATLAVGFRRYRQTSVGETVRAVRIRAAADALSRTNKPVKEIALDCGFFDQAHLTRHFRRITGFTPSQYRLRYHAARI